ncbi:MAG: NAD(P)-dependent alcohol dehydrogenase [Lysobacterales bacterium 69-70]|nr:NAD(P)-dependent alcohol dehydrogenase [Xanthomonadaceae bacterium]ODU32153.1 MAG: NADPH:quinone oxidoreductase [Xanthomonadaceae bacterium SCN 69-320]ODV19013.1 MAG: NADPH:quinone oxidoreductase [Xanthomonadaceae bacterium SCN 69-25]OJZ01875.1 MAG: NAD(P)-dependent alcohol dehydrogenase [Xanthomonadales bacterium 69-70]
MQAYHVHPGKNFDGIVAIRRAQLAPGPYEVRVRIRAVALNYRDLMVIRGDYSGGDAAPVVPASDGAGDVVEVGDKVTRVKVGDRVATTFFANWVEGRQTPEKSRNSFGGLIDGALAEEIVVSQDSLFKVPGHLDYHEAATLTCAGTTAWNSLFVEGRARPGDSVLLLGTGGVSIWGLQLAKAAGLRTLITSSSDAKLERARALGADVTINYATTPDWHEEVLRATGGEGVEVVIEVGGAGTLKKSLQATRMGGTVAIVGGVSGWGSELDPFQMIRGAKHLSGIYVGSLTMLEDLARFVALHRIKPVVDRVFPFAQARAAYEYLDSGSHFGKVVIALD